MKVVKKKIITHLISIFNDDNNDDGGCNNHLKLVKLDLIFNSFFKK